MGYFKLFASKDTYISNQKPKNNYGSDALLNLSVTADSLSSYFTRALIKFDISAANFNTLSGSTSSNFQAILNLENAQNGIFTDSEFYLELYPVTEDWTEGKGTSLLSVTSAANYTERTGIASWSVTGGSFTASPSASVFFQGGTESLTANISAFVNYWRTQPNYGILVKFPNTYETLTSSLGYANNKSFYSRTTSSLLKPTIDVIYPTTLIKDDKNNLHIGTNNFFFTDKNVSTTAYPGNAFIRTDITSTAFTAYTMNYFTTNTWYITVPNTKLSWSEYYMVVSNTSSDYSITSTITGAHSNVHFLSNNFVYFGANVQMKEDFRTDEITTVRARLFHYLGKQMGSYTTNYYPASAFLFFIETNSKYIVTPELEMSYDPEGYFYRFDMSYLSPNFWYEPVIKVIDNGNVFYKEMPESRFYVARPIY